MKAGIILLLVSTLYQTTSFAQTESNDPNVIIEYKKYESFDLGNLEIEGQLIAPGDLTVQERERRRFSRNLFERYDFDPETKQDIKTLR
jgi:hypothetical protein